MLRWANSLADVLTKHRVDRVSPWVIFTARVSPWVIFFFFFSIVLLYLVSFVGVLSMFRWVP